ncbi:MAG: hypothetical protein V2J42_02610 [Wenzhouxiangella sp.]|jgi:hypothetical protein|nr:hypothetical protein [Wenzhouxiangella sp.]
MRGSLDIEADLAIRAGSDSISVRARGRGVQVDTTSLAVFRQLPSHYRGLGNLRKVAAGLALADQAMVLTSRGVPIVDLDPARRGRWLGWLLRIPGFRLYFFNWLRHRR